MFMSWAVALVVLMKFANMLRTVDSKPALCMVGWDDGRGNKHSSLQHHSVPRSEFSTICRGDILSNVLAWFVDKRSESYRRNRLLLEVITSPQRPAGGLRGRLANTICPRPFVAQQSACDDYHRPTHPPDSGPFVAFPAAAFCSHQNMLTCQLNVAKEEEANKIRQEKRKRQTTVTILASVLGLLMNARHF